MTPVLQWALPVALVMLALAMGCALIRVLIGPSAQDRVLALDCMALNGMLLMLVLGLHYSSKNYFEAALLLGRQAGWPARRWAWRRMLAAWVSPCCC